MVLKARTRIRIPFHDVDVMHIAWHGHYIKYFEIGRTTLMQNIGLDWPDLQEIGIAMPVVEAHAQYRKSIVYNQDIWVEASIEEFEFPELKIQFRLLSCDPREAVLATGWTRQVYMSVEDRSSLFVVPDPVLQKFQSAKDRL